jgi:predicted PurR-regulated permease PerM
MDTAAEVLLIIVSAVLAIFLLVLIFVGVWTVKLIKQAKRVLEHAENVADSVEAAASAFERTATPLSVLKIISNIIGQTSRTKRKRG